MSEPVIILVPGGPGLPGYLHGLRDLLAPSFRVEEVELRDSATSAAGPPFSLEGHFEDLDRALKPPAPRRILLGHSAGACLALAYASRALPPIDGLILLSPAPMTESSREAFENELAARCRKLDARHDAQASRLARRLAESMGPAKSQALLELNALHWPAYFKDPRHLAALRFAPPKPEAIDPILADYRRWGRQGLFLRDWERVPCPVLMVHGGHDPIPYEETRRLCSQRLRSFEFILIPGAGHFPWYENPERLLWILRQWAREPG